MNVLLVTESYWPNADGGAFFERRLVQGLVAKGHHLEVWAPGRTWRSYEERDDNYVIHREKAITFLVNPKYKVSYFPLLRARRLLRRQRPDLVHIHNFGLMGASALLWARVYKIPVIATNHFMPENAILNLGILNALSLPLSKLIWNYLTFMHNRCNYVTSPTETAVRLLKENGLSAPAEPLTNGIDTQIFRPGLKTGHIQRKYHLPTDAPIVLYLGRLDGEKRVDLIISALQEFNQNVRLVLAGYGVAQKSLTNQAAALNLSNRVIFTGYVDEQDKPALYNCASVFVMASPAELQSIVMLEAMASALPVVSVDVAALSELCHDGENGFLFERDNWKQLAKGVNTILDDPTKAIAFGSESRRIVEESHSTEFMINQYEKIYKQVLEIA